MCKCVFFNKSLVSNLFQSEERDDVDDDNNPRHAEAIRKEGFQLNYADIIPFSKALVSLISRWGDLQNLACCTSDHVDDVTLMYSIDAVKSCLSCSPCGQIVRFLPTAGLIGRDKLWTNYGNIKDEAMCQIEDRVAIGINAMESFKASTCLEVFQKFDTLSPLMKIAMGVRDLPVAKVTTLVNHCVQHYETVLKNSLKLLPRENESVENKNKASTSSDSSAPLVSSQLNMPSTSAVAEMGGIESGNEGSGEDDESGEEEDANVSWGSVDDKDLLTSCAPKHIPNILKRKHSNAGVAAVEQAVAETVANLSKKHESVKSMYKEKKGVDALQSTRKRGKKLCKSARRRLVFKSPDQVSCPNNNITVGEVERIVVSSDSEDEHDAQTEQNEPMDLTLPKKKAMPASVLNKNIMKKLSLTKKPQFLRL